MSEDLYRRLMQHLSEVGTGYPQSEEFLTVLQRIMSEEEAEVVLGLPTRLPPFEVEDVDTIAGRIGRPVAEVEPILERLAEKALLFRRTMSTGKTGYAFIQMSFGIPQIFYWKGEITDLVKEIAKPLGKYLVKSTARFRGTENTRLFRYVPVNKVVDHAQQAVYSYDMMAEVVRKARKIAVVHCPCRQAVRLLTDRACTHTLETCIKFNDMAEFVLERGLGRELTKEEALEKIRQCEEEGLIHFVDNCQEEVQHNCNCCSCCCWNVAPIKRRLIPRDYLMATYFLRTTDTEKCIGCGLCATDCPLEIITMENDLPVIDESVCIGCGVCILHCPTDAACMKKKDEHVPAKDFEALYRTAIQEAVSEDKK